MSSEVNVNPINSWTEVIQPRRSVFDLRLKDVWNYRDLLGMFVKRDFLANYKQTILGPLWFFIQPILTTIMFTLIFGKFAGLPSDGLPKIPFYLAGLTIWNYFSECFNKTSSVFTSNANIFGKVYFPRLANPLAIIISNLIKFGIQLLLLIIILLYYIFDGKIVFDLNPVLFLIPYLIFLMAILGLGLGIIFSSLTTKYRDLTFLLQFGIQLLMYATPVIYPLSSATGKLKTVLSLNPLTPIIELFRKIILGQEIVDFSGLAYCSIFTVITLFIGIIVFNQVEKSFMDTV